MRLAHKRNIILNLLSLLGAYWIISSLITTIISPNSLDLQRLKVTLNENVGDGQRVEQRDQRSISRGENGKVIRAQRLNKENKENKKRTDEDDQAEDRDDEEHNIPQPNKPVYMEGSPIYKRDDPKQPGEMGSPVNIDKDKLSKEERAKYDEGYKNNAFNEYASNMISIHRSLPNQTDELCRAAKYRADLPSMTVIICFHNEAWSVLLRTVHSVIERTPANLLDEIILVDDFSDRHHLKEPLQEYMSQFGKVRILRMESRVGLIRARLKGAAAAKSAVLTYLDSHCECMEGWAEPLLDRIAEDSTVVVTPLIDTISLDTFEYFLSDHKHLSVGGFSWALQFNWHRLPENDMKAMKSRIDRVPSPTMAGGLFSIDRAFFEKLGTYDPGFDIWGGENLEISFKIWMCGGRLEIVPCSHVGHVFRKRSPYQWRTGVNVLKRNNIRLAKVWMDEYAEIYFERINHELGDYGDISSRIKLRESLNCRSFKWYLKNVFPDLFIPWDAIASGEIRNLGDTNYCVDHEADRKSADKPVISYPCHGKKGNQFWLLSKNGEIRRDEFCLDFTGSGSPNTYNCHGQKGNQLWKYDHKKGTLFHEVTRMCLELGDPMKALLMKKCDTNNARQRWKFESYNATLAETTKNQPKLTDRSTR
ncbi:hypothetical protein AB6A40_001029 [Gnathostoma spinigerum]|uniref:Polypeptide N-acetylgalactosaminyltransferase n=1 Tax=Gnathostoma spinigerum TaxID=75299 RepID=A0ABD6E497_9BILA